MITRVGRPRRRPVVDRLDVVARPGRAGTRRSCRRESRARPAVRCRAPPASRPAAWKRSTLSRLSAWNARCTWVRPTEAGTAVLTYNSSDQNAFARSPSILAADRFEDGAVEASADREVLADQMDVIDQSAGVGSGRAWKPRRCEWMNSRIDAIRPAGGVQRAGRRRPMRVRCAPMKEPVALAPLTRASRPSSPIRHAHPGKRINHGNAHHGTTNASGAFEESLWTADATHYRESIDEQCLMVLPKPPFVMRRAAGGRCRRVDAALVQRRTVGASGRAAAGRHDRRRLQGACEHGTAPTITRRIARRPIAG